MKTYKEICVERPIQPGDRIRILKGTRIRTTHPKGPYNCTRTYTVTVHCIYPGYDGNEYRKFPARKPEVCWVGSGSYWFYTDMDNVEKVQC